MSAAAAVAQISSAAAVARTTRLSTWGAAYGAGDRRANSIRAVRCYSLAFPEGRRCRTENSAPFLHDSRAASTLAGSRARGSGPDWPASCSRLRSRRLDGANTKRSAKWRAKRVDVRSGQSETGRRPEPAAARTSRRRAARTASSRARSASASGATRTRKRKKRELGLTPTVTRRLARSPSRAAVLYPIDRAGRRARGGRFALGARHAAAPRASTTSAGAVVYQIATDSPPALRDRCGRMARCLLSQGVCVDAKKE